MRQVLFVFKDVHELRALFKPFETLILGEYYSVYFYDDEGSANNFIFIVIKR